MKNMNTLDTMQADLQAAIDSDRLSIAEIRAIRERLEADLIDGHSKPMPLGTGFYMLATLVVFAVFVCMWLQLPQVQ